jgi:hypothetical protein
LTLSTRSTDVNALNTYQIMSCSGGSRLIMRFASSCSDIACPLTFVDDNDGLDGGESYGELLQFTPHSIV